MKPLIVLFASLGLSLIILKLIQKNVDYQLAGRISMSAMLVFTAIGHFVFAKGMESMIPDFLPFKSQLVLLTGIMEIAFALLLLFPQYKTLTGWTLILFFILVLPANIKAAIEQVNYQTGELDGPGLDYLWFRIPFQIHLILWVYLSTIYKLN